MKVTIGYVHEITEVGICFVLVDGWFWRLDVAEDVF